MCIRILLIFCLLLHATGCHSLRKKFVRKSKKKKDIPVYLNLKDYPSKPTKEAYIDYYLFVRGWLDDLMQALETGISYKREMRAVDEALMNLEQIISFYSIEGKEKIYGLYEELVDIRSQITKDPHMSEMKRRSLIKKIEHIQRDFALHFTYDDALQWME